MVLGNERRKLPCFASFDVSYPRKRRGEKTVTGISEKLKNGDIFVAGSVFPQDVTSIGAGPSTPPEGNGATAHQQESSTTGAIGMVSGEAVGTYRIVAGQLVSGTVTSGIYINDLSVNPLPAPRDANGDPSRQR